jgi:hypothetical protein
MKKDKTINDNPVQPEGKFRLSIKRKHDAPRHKIRQLLRSFMPLAEVRQWEKSGNASD